MSELDAATVPVTLLAGFLGAGKTTLVNRILSERHGEPIAVVVNEFGELGIDGRLVVGASEEIVELANGCLCCTLRGDLSRALTDLLRARARRFARRPFERVLIEASGLASPGPIAQTLAVDARLCDAFELDGILALANAPRIAQQLEEHPEAAEQLAYADRVLLNHADRASEDELDRAEGALRAVNPTAEVQRSVRAEVAIGPLLSLESTRPSSWRLGGPHGAHAHGPQAVGAVVLESEHALDLQRLKMWLRFLSTRRTHELFRIKGVLRCEGHEAPVVVQAVYEWLELGPGAGTAPERSQLVLLGRDLDEAELRRGWEACWDSNP